MCTYNICYMDMSGVMMQRLRTQASEADRLHERSRSMLAEAVRAGIQSGLTQKQVAEAIGRSQPEVSRLLRFHSSTKLGLLLRKNRAAIMEVAADHSLTNIRVFGSLSKGIDPSDGEIDLLVEVDNGAGNAGLDAASERLSSLLSTRVRLINDASFRRNRSDRALADAVAL